jgi:predicted NAD/FAD-binding protein
MHKTIAVIGSGISGLSAAWLSGQAHDVTLFEKAPVLGGHSNTVVVDTADGAVPVDTGFIVFNELNYENLTAMFAHLGVETAPSDMGFAVSVGNGRMEYSGQNLKGLFGQKRNIVKPRHWRLVGDILRFFREAETQARSIPDSMSIGDFLDAHGYSEAFAEDHLLPISAAIWSTPARSMLEFPAQSFIKFFANHHLLKVNINERPTWRTVQGGSRHYVSALAASGRFKAETNARIAQVERHAEGVDLVFSDGARRRFDEVVFACHADEALALLHTSDDDERAVLSAFGWTQNHAVLHTDQSFMPKRRHLWSAWNYRRTAECDGTQLSLSYWMNKLQPLPTATPVFVTLNPGHDFAPGSVHYETTYSHPLFDAKSVRAQHEMGRIQGRGGLWYAGAWLGYGFHEDGLQAGLEVAERLGGVRRPWQVKKARDRIAHTWAGEEEALWAAE